MKATEKEMTATKEYLTISEVANALDLNYETVRLCVRDGIVKAQRVPTRKQYGKRRMPGYRITASELARVKKVVDSGLPLSAA